MKNRVLSPIAKWSRHIAQRSPGQRTSHLWKNMSWLRKENLSISRVTFFSHEGSNRSLNILFQMGALSLRMVGGMEHLEQLLQSQQLANWAPPPPLTFTGKWTGLIRRLNLRPALGSCTMYNVHPGQVFLKISGNFHQNHNLKRQYQGI